MLVEALQSQVFQLDRFLTKLAVLILIDISDISKEYTYSEITSRLDSLKSFTSLGAGAESFEMSSLF